MRAGRIEGGQNGPRQLEIVMGWRAVQHDYIGALDLIREDARRSHTGRVIAHDDGVEKRLCIDGQHD